MVSIFITVLFVILASNNQKKTRDLVDGLRSDYIGNQKTSIKQRVQSVVDKINYEQTQTVNLLEKNIYSRVLEAHQIASNIYQKNSYQSKSVISKNIYNALNPIRFNENRGYFFIFTMQGVSVLHPLIPQIEGQSKIKLQDVHGTFILKEHIDLIKKSKNGEAFYRWWFRKPGHGDTEFEKIGFAKRFEEYDWLIGTGEYVSDVQNSIKKNLLNWLSNFSFGNDGFVIVTNYDGKVLSHIKQTLIGHQWEYASFLSSLTLADNQGDFIKVQNNLTRKSQIFYVHSFPLWEWFLIAPVSLSKIDTYLIDKEKKLIIEGKAALYKILVACTIFALVLGIISIYIGNYINRRFYDFQSKIQDSFSKLKESQGQLEYLAHHDPLTGLANRTKLSKQLECAIKMCHSTKTMLAVMFVDIDDFKKINDQYGHRFGDKFIKLIGQKIKSLVGKHDIAARFGGDEFIVCFSLIKSEQEIKAKSYKLLALFENTITLNGVRLKVSSSIGIAVYPKDGENEEELISKSDIVLYRTKEKCKGTALFYDTNINKEVQYQFLLEDELSSALRNDEISVVYQPQVDTQTGQLKAVEALCRWNNKKLGLIPAQQFIPIAESKGLIHSIGDYIFSKACADIHHFCANTNQSIGLSINVSPLQLLESNFAFRLKEFVNNIGVLIQNITIEITENVLIEDIAQVKPILDEIKEYGFGISLDDFGTGYCSLSYLSQLPITEIKIDRTFVQAIGQDKQIENVMKSILAVANVSKLIVVAEGVECYEQSLWLKNNKCQLSQGYLHGQPMKLEALFQKYKKK
ncbi:EAL domain-containing protein [Candidatus Photodesmus blepharus]|nr:EAL domain-containing protein [Candidatus Photodesmus blepharus]